MSSFYDRFSSYLSSYLSPTPNEANSNTEAQGTGSNPILEERIRKCYSDLKEYPISSKAWEVKIQSCRQLETKFILTNAMEETIKQTKEDNEKIQAQIREVLKKPEKS